MSDLIGKTCFYRPLFAKEVISAKVDHLLNLVSVDGAPLTLAVMDNGDKINAKLIYFLDPVMSQPVL